MKNTSRDIHSGLEMLDLFSRLVIFFSHKEAAGRGAAIFISMLWVLSLLLNAGTMNMHGPTGAAGHRQISVQSGIGKRSSWLV